MKNIKWNLEKVKRKVAMAERDFYEYIICSIDDEIFERANKLYRENFEHTHINCNYGGDVLFGFHKDTRGMVSALNLLIALNQSKDLKHFFDIVEDKDLNYSCIATGVAFLLTNKHVQKIVNMMLPYHYTDIFFLSLNRYLTIEQAHYLITKVSTGKQKSRNEFNVFSLVTLLVMYSKFYRYRKEHSEFYELLTSEMERLFPLYEEWKNRPIERKVLRAY